MMTTVITACPKPRRAGVAIGLKPERVAQLIRDVISRDQLTPGRLTEVIYDADALDPGLIRTPIPSMTRGRNGSRRTRGFADAVQSSPGSGRRVTIAAPSSSLLPCATRNLNKVVASDVMGIGRCAARLASWSISRSLRI
jgi:hypothetical protein